MELDFCRSGLVAEIHGQEVSVPLTGVSVQANIIDLVAEVSIEQRYVNKENNPIEAVYKFPLDEGKFHFIRITKDVKSLKENAFHPVAHSGFGDAEERDG